MKKNILAILIVVVLATSIDCFSNKLVLNFVGTGASNTIDSVIVLNTRTSEQIKIDSGNSLSLNLINDINDVKVSDHFVSICPNPIVSFGIISFPVINSGSVSLKIFSLDGKLITESTNELNIGEAKYRVVLPKGVFLIQVQGNGFKYTSKLISQSIIESKVQLSIEDNQVFDKLISKVQDTTFYRTNSNFKFNKGDQLFFKAYSSGKYCTYYTECPSESKTINFNFVDCTDADGNHYATVKIGTQLWMGENLYATKFRSGDTVPNVKDATAWSNLTTPGLCAYKNSINKDSISKFGRLYNWYVVDDKRDIAPKGWHVSTQSEWLTLTDYLAENSGISINYIKALAASTDWYSSTDTYSPGAIGYNTSINNSSGFCALPIGSRLLGNAGFRVMNKLCSWWTADDYSINSGGNVFLNVSGLKAYIEPQSKQLGNSIRCVKD